METPPAPARARLRARIGAVVVLLLVGLGCAVLVAALGDHGSVAEVVRDSPEEPTVQAGAIYVHILGAVRRPGLYELREGDRAVDAVAAAGGLLETADQAGLNLARFVVDGEQLVVPAVGEGPAVTPGMTAAGKINLNTADAALLDTLPRVGPALAGRIIDWRTANGRFSTIEDLLSVSGIGDATFAGLKDLVAV